MTRFLRIGDRLTRFVIPRAFGGLGSAIPAVVGAWYADKNRRPIGMFGDGSFNMTVGELETLVGKKVPALMMLFNNGCFGWIKGLHRLKGHDGCFGVDFLPPRGQAIAEAFDIKAWTVTTPDELIAALDEAFEYDGPCLMTSASSRSPIVCRRSTPGSPRRASIPWRCSLRTSPTCRLFGRARRPAQMPTNQGIP
jgi:acetolactate synthase-1/2/3 large subunit